MTVTRRTLALTFAAVFAAACALAAASLAPVAGAKAKVVRLKAFQSCGNLIRYGNRYADKGMPVRFAPATVGAPARGTPQPTAAPAPAGAENQAVSGGGSDGAGLDFSTTNVQEEGVDEPDIVKTDGKVLFAVGQGKIHAVDVRAAQPKALGAIALPDGYDHQLLLHGKRLLVTYMKMPQVQPVEAAPAPGPPARTSSTVAPSYYQPSAVLAEIDVSDPAAMKTVRTMTVDGEIVSARLNGSTARVIVQSVPGALRADPPPAAEAARTRDRRRAAAWLPSSVRRNLRSGHRKRKAVVACRAVRRTTAFSGLGMLTVLTIDITKGLAPVDSDSLMTGAETVYASNTTLYVATQRFYESLQTQSPARIPSGVTTAIHKFDISDSQSTVYKGSGAVPGFLLSQWALSERNGVLRVASTSTPVWLGPETQVESQSFVTTLDERAGVLAQLGQVAGLGKGERIYAVRFIDDIGYVVTFRQVDPLYTVDVSDPKAPKVAGELKILGYSAYLHPVGEDLLLGVGQDATEEGRRLGAQLSLFDVSDVRNPVRLHQRRISDSSSTEAEYDHHAFLYWAPTKLAMLPVQIYDFNPDGQPRDPFTGAIGFGVDKAAGITETGRVTHTASGYGPQIRRSVVVGDRVFTLSEAGVKASTLDKLGDVAWVAFS